MTAVSPLSRAKCREVSVAMLGASATVAAAAGGTADLGVGSHLRVQAGPGAFSNVTSTQSAVYVHTPDERGNSKGRSGHPQFNRQLSLVVECYCTSATVGDATDRADALAEAVADELLEDASWVASWEAIEAVNVHVEPMEESGRPLVVAVVTIDLRYTASYRPREQTGGSFLATVHTDLDMLDPGTPGTVEHQQTITGLDT